MLEVWVLVWINVVEYFGYVDDLMLCCDYVGVIGLFLLKVESVVQVCYVVVVSGKLVWFIVESVCGFVVLGEIVVVVGVEWLFFGSFDLVLDFDFNSGSNVVEQIFGYVCYVLFL